MFRVMTIYLAPRLLGHSVLQRQLRLSHASTHVMFFKETLLRLRSSEIVVDADLFMHFVGLQVIHVAATTHQHGPVSLVAR